MLRLLCLATFCLSCLGDPKAPRIYNVLISSKKNLSPSQAVPVYEPVIRTTSLGYFPPLTIYSTLGHPYRVIPQYTPYAISTEVRSAQGILETQRPIEQQPIDLKKIIKLPPEGEQDKQQITNNKDAEDSGKAPLPFEQFVPYYSPLLPNYAPQVLKQPLGNPQVPNFEQINENESQTNSETGQPPKFTIPRPENFPALAKETDPKHSIANLRQKSDIPDVPPPPLPVRTKS